MSRDGLIFGDWVLHAAEGEPYLARRTWDIVMPDDLDDRALREGLVHVQSDERRVPLAALQALAQANRDYRVSKGWSVPVASSTSGAPK